jgi:hypothetical protein
MKIKKLIGFVVLFCLFSFSVAHGQVIITNPAQIGNVQDFLSHLSTFLWLLVAPLATIMMIWAGILFVTSNGDPSKVTKAKNLVMYVIIGIVVALLAGGLSALIKDIMG